MVSSTRRKRFVACVDGTWYNEDGQEDHSTGNQSNIFRIYASIKRGSCRDNDGNEIEQYAEYYPGIGVEKSPLNKFNDGMTGDGCITQIQTVYWDCMNHAKNDQDEVWLFGFSRGAYVVRVVAALLHSYSMQEPNEDKGKVFAKMKSIIRQGKLKVPTGGQIWRLRDKHGRPPPKIKLLGLFDTVKQTSVFDEIDVSNIGAGTNVRHALALNEERLSFPILDFPPAASSENTKRHVQAWFVGAHADMGGGALRDGLSLYPLQWMLIESRDQGLVLEHRTQSHVSTNLIQNPLDLVFPKPPLDPSGQGQVDSTSNSSVDSIESTAPRPWNFRYDNGLSISMYDLRQVHQHGNLQGVDVKGGKLERKSCQKTLHGSHQVRINYGVFGLWGLGQREVFSRQDLGVLSGYRKESIDGTVVHPSVYFLLDTYASLGIEKAIGGLKSHLEPFREQLKYLHNGEVALSDPWIRDIQHPDSSCRILICGNTGVGKSTLLNEVFGIPMTKVNPMERGIHNIDVGFENDQYPGIIIHDSEGFQPGNPKEVNAFKDFIKRRSKHSEARENLHTIWLCIQSDTPRPVQSAFSTVLAVVSEIDRSIPVIIVGTMKDKFLKEHYEEHPTPNGPGVDEKAVAERVALWKDRFEHDAETESIWPLLTIKFLFVSNRDEASIKALIHLTAGCVDTPSVRNAFWCSQAREVDPKIKLAVEHTLTLLRAAVTNASLGAGLAISSTVGTPSISRSLCEKIAYNSFGIPKKTVAELTTVLDKVVWRNLAPFMAQSLAQSTFIWTGVAFLTIFTVVGGIPLALGAPLLEAPAAARMIIKCACDLIIILDRSFRDGGRSMTKDKIQFLAKAYVTDKMVPTNEQAVKVEVFRRKAVHQAVNDLFPLVAGLAVDAHRAKTVSKYRERITEIINAHRFEGKLDDSTPASEAAGRASSSTAVDIAEDHDDMAQFRAKRE